MEATFWRRCNNCKKEIPFGVTYYVCSVTTCHRKGTDFSFCSVPCWDAHVPTFRHRDAWAEDRRSPNRAEWQRSLEAEKSAAQSAPAAPKPVSVTPAPSRPAVAAPPASRPESVAPVSEPSPANPLSGSDPSPHDVLVVASKLKAYIRNRSGMNTSDGVLAVLSERLRELCDDAILRAAESGRKTVLDRDF